MTGPVDLVVVGAGITGLAAAWEATQRGASVVVLDPGPPGGKVRSSAFAGGALDEAADAFLARVPEGIALCRELGLGGDLVAPASRTARVWSRGTLRPLPAEQVLGVPTDLDALAASGILSPEGLARAGDDLARPLAAPAGDPTIGALVRDRLGGEVLERLVDPLVGGINAGDCDHLSLAATVPQLDAAARSGARSLVEACAAQRAAAPDPAAPVFFAPRGGMGALVAALVAALADEGVEVLPVRAQAIERAGPRWRVRVGDASGGSTSSGADSGSGTKEDGGAGRGRPGRGEVLAAAVAVATPAGPAAGLLAPHAPRAAEVLARISYASVALLSIAAPRAAIDRDLDASGYLVPRVEGLLVTACSWTSTKWAHLGADGTAWLRVSAGRAGDDRALAMADDQLTAAALADLDVTMDLRGRPDEVRISRWPGSLPQYRPGHLDRVATAEADLARSAPGLGATGAWARGLGVPACIRQGRALAAALLARSPA